MIVYVFCEAARSAPICVLTNPERRPPGLPNDAVEQQWNPPEDSKARCNYGLIGEWSSEAIGCSFYLFAYPVIERRTK